MWRAALLLGAVFAGGVVVGGAAALMAVRREQFHDPSAGHRGRGGEMYVRRLTGELDLSHQQQDSVRSILDRHRGEMDSIWHEVEPRFATLRSAIRSEIQGVLTPEQRQRYGDLLQRMDSERRRPGP
jgi:Spy/CpxP family protein refolding chaperone